MVSGPVLIVVTLRRWARQAEGINSSVAFSKLVVFIVSGGPGIWSMRRLICLI
jgi:hypothetical protein